MTYQLTKNIVIIFSHSDIYSRIGGVEKYLQEESAHLKIRNIDVFQIYPVNKIKKNILKKDTIINNFGINYNDKNILKNINFTQLQKFITDTLNLNRIELVCIHHLLYWNLDNMLNILQILKGINLLYYVHDMYSACTSKFLYKNNKEYCQVIETYPQNICNGCCFYDGIELHRSQISKILALSYKIICPSIIVKKMLETIYNDQNITSKIKVVEHLNLTPIKNKKCTNGNRKINIAFLGSSAGHKGYRTFKILAKNKQLKSIYKFYIIGKTKDKIRNVEIKNYSFFENGIHAARDCLLENNIDIALLWSIVPESYSYTLHEACSAGVPVISNPNSGNIADKVKSNKIYGKVVESENDLINFLLNPEHVANFLSGNKNSQICDIKNNYAIDKFLSI